MLLLRKPSTLAIGDFLAGQAGLDFTCPAVGATAGDPPSGYAVDRARVRIGDGETDFKAARFALENWDQFRLGWVEPCLPVPPIAAGQVVGVLAHSLGLWWLNACRIVYVVAAEGPVKRFGFAYGTLPDHAEMGEERFLVELDETGSVWYDILAFSRPRHPLARLGYPLVRRLQKRFARDSAAAMSRSVRGQRGKVLDRKAHEK